MSALYYFRLPLLHVIDGTCVVCALQSTLTAVCFVASPQCFSSFLLFLRPLGVKGGVVSIPQVL